MTNVKQVGVLFKTYLPKLLRNDLNVCIRCLNVHDQGSLIPHESQIKMRLKSRDMLSNHLVRRGGMMKFSLFLLYKTECYGEEKEIRVHASEQYVA